MIATPLSTTPPHTTATQAVSPISREAALRSLDALAAGWESRGWNRTDGAAAGARAVDRTRDLLMSLTDTDPMPVVAPEWYGTIKLTWALGAEAELSVDVSPFPYRYSWRLGANVADGHVDGPGALPGLLRWLLDQVAEVR